MSGKCKFTIPETKELYSSPYLEFIINYIKDNKINSIEDFIINGYFKNRNVLCNEEICIKENVGNIQNFSYNVLNFPKIVNIYILEKINLN